MRDVAQAHVRALLLPEASGKRFGVATRGFYIFFLLTFLGTFTLQVLLDQIHAAGVPAEFPEAIRGEPGATVPPTNWFDCSKSLKELDLKPTHESSTA